MSENPLTPQEEDDIKNNIIGQHFVHVLAKSFRDVSVVFSNRKALQFVIQNGPEDGDCTLQWFPAENIGTICDKPITRISLDTATVGQHKSPAPNANGEHATVTLVRVLEVLTEVNGKENPLGMLAMTNCITDSTRKEVELKTSVDIVDAEEEKPAESDASVSSRLNKMCRGASILDCSITPDLHGAEFEMSNGVSFTVRDVHHTAYFRFIEHSGVEDISDIPVKKFSFGMSSNIVDMGGPTPILSIMEVFKSRVSKRPFGMLTISVPDQIPDDAEVHLTVEFHDNEMKEVA